MTLYKGAKLIMMDAFQARGPIERRDMYAHYLFEVVSDSPHTWVDEPDGSKTLTVKLVAVR